MYIKYSNFDKESWGIGSRKRGANTHLCNDIKDLDNFPNLSFASLG